MNWGKSILMTFILFAAFIGTLVYICVRQDISLVSGTYYEDELVYGKQMDRMRNAASLVEKPEILASGDSLRISFARFGSVEGGRVTVFRPSDARWDKSFLIEKGPGNVRGFPIGNCPPGMYKVKLDWSMGGKEYYLEEIINR